MQQGKMYLFSGLIMTIIQGGFVRRFKSDQGTSVYIALIVSEQSALCQTLLINMLLDGLDGRFLFELSASN